MSPQLFLHCVRHGEGYHNLGDHCWTIRDPKLTPRGEQQCEDAREAYFGDLQAQISLIAASPLTRTLQTALLVFQPALAQPGRDLKIIALPDAQEMTSLPCDFGTELPALKEAVAKEGWPVDLSLVGEDWVVKDPGSRYSPSAKALTARARSTRQYLKDQGKALLAQSGGADVHMALVTHGGYLHFFTNDWEDSTTGTGTAWKNCEARTYTFENLEISGPEDDAFVLETAQSRAKRGKTNPVPDREEQKLLSAQAMDGWERQGLANPAKIVD
ncbi:histidine phosphatase superfamily [Xylariales sp. PMI_506]|nr:histidine phosphatase superfamily [Xylariales sp. PMI_506]